MLSFVGSYKMPGAEKLARERRRQTVSGVFTSTRRHGGTAAGIETRLACLDQQLAAVRRINLRGVC